MLISLLFIGLSLTVCDFLRQQIRKRASPSLIRSVTLDFFVAFEQCFVSLEMGAIFEHYGQAYWSMMLVLFTLYQILRWQECDMPTPINHLLDHLSGSKNVSELLLRVVVLMASGLFSYRYAKALWALEYSHVHFNRPTVMDACVSPWKDVPVHHASASEFIGSFVLGILPNLVMDNPYLANNDPIYSAILIAILVLVTVTAALDFSGGMFNPMLASVLVGGCHGHTLLEHVLIYWVGSTLGAVVAYKCYPRIQSLCYPPVKKVNNDNQDNKAKVKPTKEDKKASTEDKKAKME